MRDDGEGIGWVWAVKVSPGMMVLVGLLERWMDVYVD